MSQSNYSDTMKWLEQKVDRMIEQVGDKCPHVAGKDGIYNDVQEDWWTSGFWPGLLWIMHEMTGKEHYKKAASGWDEKIQQWMIKPSEEFHHDVGFQFLPTAIVKHRITGDELGLDRGLKAANFMAGRFNPAGNFIRAWNFDYHGWAIIDCMMNLSLLYWASEQSKDPRFKHIANRHAETALKHFVRPDGSVCHIVSFDPESGEFIEALGGQGYGPNSAWSRGAAWALYGFANCYKYTDNLDYLNASKRIANYFIASLSVNAIPQWDFRVETPNDEPRDTSAAAIAASGLLEIAKHVPEVEGKFYKEKAQNILDSLLKIYGTKDKPEHQAILTGGTGHKPANQNVDVSIIYGDYFYVEAIAKLNGWKGNIF